MSQIIEKHLEYHFGNYEKTSIENRMKISMAKRCFENMIRFYYYVEENFIPIYSKEQKHPDCFHRFKKSETLKNELSMNDILDEYLEIQHKNTLEYEPRVEK